MSRSHHSRSRHARTMATPASEQTSEQFPTHHHPEATGAGTGWTDDERIGPDAPRWSVGVASGPPARHAPKALTA
eukprot:1769945-Pleurochrysis_carterae.AAC.1